MTTKTLLVAVGLLAATSVSQAQLLFTQYYEGASNNKSLELTNVGTGSIDLSTYSVSLFTNAFAENWKVGDFQGQSTSGSNPTGAASTYAMTGILASGASIVLYNGSSALPTYVGTSGAINVANPGLPFPVTGFNGNDSLVLWDNSVTFATAAIYDALSFTNSGNEGVDKSFVRLTAGSGYNLTAGSDILDFPTVWGTITNATADSASAGTNNYIGFSSVAVPEPGSMGLMLGGVGAMAWFFRKRRAAPVC